MKASEMLTAREDECMRMLCQGLDNPEIARRTGMSVGTVRTHLMKAYARLGVRGTSDPRTLAAVTYVRRMDAR